MRLVLIKFWRQRLEIMLFNSIAFICVFLPVIFILYYLLPGKIKDIALVAGGAVFFAWGAPVNLVVLAFFILFNYAVGIQMEGYMRRRRSTEQLFAGSILINMIVYVFFAFIGQRVGFISEVPVGIGICILQVLSYLIEIHRGNVKAQKSILDFAVYIAMFPLFLAGPVVKYPQIRKELKTRKLSWAKAGEGIALFVCGFAKKVIIADYLADSFTKIMSLKAGELSVFGAWLGCAIFMFQIYFAFSGYCDMAVGLCRMLGFDVKKNFRYPYVARNITTFVRRFNSSVFAWFWDYICEPLWGGWLGTLVSGILMGLWYAGMWKNAPWQVTVTGGLLWGIYLAFWQIVERYALPFLKRLPPVLGQIYTWFFTALGWVFFFGKTPAASVGYLKVMFGFGGGDVVGVMGRYLFLGNVFVLVVAFLASTPLPNLIWKKILVFGKKDKKEKNKKRLERGRSAVFVFAAVIVILCLVNVTGAGRTFFKETMKDTQAKLDTVLGRRDVNGVYRGKNQYLLADINKLDEKKVQANVDAITALAEDYSDVPMYMALIPDAANVWADKLPSYAPVEDQTVQIAQIQSMLGDSVNWIDAQSVLNTNKDKEIYYHTDSRWTTLGASLVWQQIASDLGLDTSKAPALKPYVVTGDFSGNLSRTSGFESGYREPIYAYLTENASDNTQMVASYESEGIKTAELYDRTKLDEPDAYEVFLGGDYDKIDIRTTADSTDRLLLVKDSFADCMIPFLIPYYREIIVVDADYYQKHVSDLLDKNKITSVLFLYDCNHFVQDDKLSSILTTDKAE